MVSASRKPGKHPPRPVDVAPHRGLRVVSQPAEYDLPIYWQRWASGGVAHTVTPSGTARLDERVGWSSPPACDAASRGDPVMSSSSPRNPVAPCASRAGAPPRTPSSASPGTSGTAPSMTSANNDTATLHPRPPRDQCDRGPRRLRRPGLALRRTRLFVVAEHIATGASLSTVNLAEVSIILIRNDRDPATALDLPRSQVEIVAFTDNDAITTAELHPRVSARGLSLGDRACFALAQRLEVPAVTAEHLWVGLDIKTIRTPNAKSSAHPPPQLRHREPRATGSGDGRRRAGRNRCSSTERMRSRGQCTTCCQVTSPATVSGSAGSSSRSNQAQ